MKPKNKRGYYRSGLEKALAEKLPKDFEYEPYAVPYVTHRKYTPDFVNGKFLIECKGFFRAGDTMKYKAIRDCIDGELIFVLSDRNKKVRKGSKMTMGQWCDKEGLAHFLVDEHRELLNHIKLRVKENT
tara:strand:- start:326 stop:712 length:387 start_codon:yes stop_codon:yes gene_type:complete